MTILILDAHSNAAVSTIGSLGRAGFQVEAMSSNPIALSFHSSYCRYRHECVDPLEYAQQFVADLVSLLANRQIDLVFPTTDSSIWALMKFAPNQLKKASLLPPEEAFTTAFDKQKTLELAQSLGVPVPGSAYIQDSGELEALAHKIHLPVFVKPVSSKQWLNGTGANLSPVKVNNKEDLKRFAGKFLKYGAIQVQEIVTGDGYGIEILADKGTVVQAFAHKRIHEYPLTGGGSTLRVALAMPERMLRHVEAMVARMVWDGVAMFEFKGNQQEFWLMEVNGRLWGSVPLAVSCGVNFPLLWVQQRLGLPMQTVGQYPLLYQRNIAGDVRWQLANIKVKTSQDLPHARSKFWSLLGLLNILTFRERWDHVSFHDLPLARRTVTEVYKIVANPIKARLAKNRIHAQAKRNFQDIRRTAAQADNVLLVCYGNIYRSAFAGEYLKSVATDLNVNSCGFHEKVQRTSPDSVTHQALLMGVNLADHRSQRINDQLCEWADVILLMDYDNLVQLLTEFPQSANKATLLGFYVNVTDPDIQDPYNQSAEILKEVLNKITNAVDSFLLLRISQVDRGSA